MNLMTYDGKSCLDFNSVLVKSSNGVLENRVGKTITYNSTQNYYSQKFKKNSSLYQDVISETFKLIKYDTLKGFDTYYTEFEAESIINWLNSDIYKKATFQLDKKPEINQFYYNCYFNVDKIIHNERIIGFEVTMYCDSAFAYKDQVEYLKFTNTTKTVNFGINNGRVGFVYPTLEITIEEQGDFELYNNDNTNRITKFKNCNVGDKIVIDCENKVFTTNNEQLRARGNFNYVFPRFNYSFENNIKSITTNKRCTISLTLQTYHKIGVF